jgi:ribosomal protein L34E
MFDYGSRLGKPLKKIFTIKTPSGCYRGHWSRRYDAQHKLDVEVKWIQAVISSALASGHTPSGDIIQDYEDHLSWLEQCLVVEIKIEEGGVQEVIAT